MNFSAQGKFWIDHWQTKIVGFIFGLICLPLVIGLGYLLLSQDRATHIEPLKVVQAQSWIEPLPADARFSQEYLRQLHQTQGDFAQADWKTTALPSVIELGAKSPLGDQAPMSRAWFKFKATVPASLQPSDPLVLYGGRAMGGPYSVWVNDQLIFAQLDDWRMMWNRPIYVTIPNHVAKPGQSLEIYFALPHRASLGYALGSLYIGQQSEIKFTRDLRYLLQIGMPLISMLLMAITGLFSLFIWFRRQRETAHFWLFVLSISLIACNLQFTHDIDASLSGSKWFGSLVDSSISWVFLSFFIFVQKYSGFPFPKITQALAVFTATNTILTLPLWNWQVNAILLQHYILLAIYANVLLLITWIAMHHPKPENLLFCVAIWMMLLTGLHDLSFMTAQLKPDGIFYFPYGAFFLYFVAEYLLRRRYQAALSQVENNNQVLHQKLGEREREIMAQQALLQQARDQAVLQAERVRLTRDIHDGIGSALTGTLIQLRGKTTSADQAADQVQRCLEDIRLVMDSMESTQTDLPTLFASLRRRFSDAFLAAGVNAHWEINDLEGLQLIDASASLHLARAIQEILTNCLKHAQAKNVSIKASFLSNIDNQAQLMFEIADDGKGFDPQLAKSGRGLGNIRQRIEQLKGELRVESSTGAGMRMCIVLPAIFA